MISQSHMLSLGSKDFSKMIRHLKFIYVWIWLIPQLTDGGSVTWYEPTPVETTSNPAEVLPRVILVANEGKPTTLNWNYSLTLGLALGVVRFNGVGLVSIQSDGSAGPVKVNFQERFSVSSTPGRISLSISPVTAADDKANGEFSCSLTDSAPDTWKRAIQVQVIAPANITGINGKTTLLEGDNLNLTCVASGRPEPNITWTKEETGNQGNTVVLSEGKVLTIEKISRNDSGLFNCTAYNGFGKAERRTVYVNVTYPAKIVKFQAEHIVGLNQSVTLNCTAEGNPPPAYTWTPCDSGQVCDESTLNLLNVCNDVNYTCKVANIHGNNSKRANVYIGGDVINITITLKSEPCKDGLNNKSSVEEAFKKQLKDVFADKQFGYEGVQSINVGCENKTIDLELKFNSTRKEKNVIITLMDAVLKSGDKLGEFSVTAIKLKTCPTNMPVTSPPSTGSSSGGMDWLKILLGALGAACGCGLVGIGCWKCGPRCPYCTKNKCSKEVHSNEDRGVEMDGDYSSVNTQYAAAGPNANYRASNQSPAPPATYEVADRRSEGRRGNGASEVKEPLPQYAKVDMKKKKKKTPKPGELQYAELGELTGPRQNAVLPRVSGSDTVYSDIRS